MSHRNPHYSIFMQISALETRIQKIKPHVSSQEHEKLDMITSDLDRFKSKLKLDSFDMIVAQFEASKQEWLNCITNQM